MPLGLIDQILNLEIELELVCWVQSSSLELLFELELALRISSSLVEQLASLERKSLYRLDNMLHEEPQGLPMTNQNGGMRGKTKSS